MKKLIWNDSYSTGIKIIDEQHRVWIGHFNTLVDAIDKCEGQNQLINTLDFLVDYTRFHFDTEEKHMTEQKYPGLAEHRKKHEELSVTLNNLIADFEEEGTSQVLANYLNNFLSTWLFKHIDEVDKKFAAFLKEKNISIC